MTDKLTAEERFQIIIGKAMYTESLKRECIEQIKSAQKVAYERGKTERHQQCPYEAGFIAGQEDMQKRAAKRVEDYGDKSSTCRMVADFIRDLPIKTGTEG